MCHKILLVALLMFSLASEIASATNGATKGSGEACHDNRSLKRCTRLKLLGKCEKKGVAKNCQKTCGLCAGSVEACHDNWSLRRCTKNERRGRCEKPRVAKNCQKTCGFCTEPQCGISVVPSGRIVGGEAVKPHSLPWQVRTECSTCCGTCGGTLISKRHVLTAAHCEHRDGITIWVGQHTREPMDGIPYKVCKASTHPMWNDDEEYDMYDFEILHLEKDVVLDETVQIACLPTMEDGLNDDFLDGKDLIASGWGHQNYDQHNCPNELHSVVLPGYSNERCKKESDYSFTTMNSIICAGEEGKDACQGDSGGPLMYYNEGRATVVGVVSTGRGCGYDNYPGIFGRVTSVLDWINDELNKTCIDFEDQN